MEYAVLTGPIDALIEKNLGKIENSMDIYSWGGVKEISMIYGFHSTPSVNIY